MCNARTKTRLIFKLLHTLIDGHVTTIQRKVWIGQVASSSNSGHLKKHRRNSSIFARTSPIPVFSRLSWPERTDTSGLIADSALFNSFKQPALCKFSDSKIAPPCTTLYLDCAQLVLVSSSCVRSLAKTAIVRSGDNRIIQPFFFK